MSTTPEFEEAKKKVKGTWRLKFPFDFDFYAYPKSGDARCGHLYVEFVKCADVHGLQNAKYKCTDVMEDFIECNFGTKMFDRNVLIEKEIKRKGLKPKLEKSE